MNVYLFTINLKCHYYYMLIFYFIHLVDPGSVSGLHSVSLCNLVL